MSASTQGTELFLVFCLQRVPPRSLTNVRMKNQHLTIAAQFVEKTFPTHLNSSVTYGHTLERGLSLAPCVRRDSQKKDCL